MREFHAIHTVILDLDDTLFPEGAFVLSGFAAVDQWLRTEKGVEGLPQATALFARGERGRIFDQVLAELELLKFLGLLPRWSGSIEGTLQRSRCSPTRENS